MAAQKTGNSVEKLGRSCFWWECEVLQAVSYEAKHEMTITSSSQTLLIIYPKEMKTNYMFIMSLFLIFQNWNQPSKWADLLQQVNGLTGVHTNYRILLISKKKQTTIHTET